MCWWPKMTESFTNQPNFICPPPVWSAPFLSIWFSYKQCAMLNTTVSVRLCHFGWACFHEISLLLSCFWDSCFWPLGPSWPLEYSYLYHGDCSFSSQRINYLRSKPPRNSLFSFSLPPAWFNVQVFFKKNNSTSLQTPWVLCSEKNSCIIQITCSQGIIQMHANTSHSVTLADVLRPAQQGQIQTTWKVSKVPLGNSLRWIHWLCRGVAS